MKRKFVKVMFFGALALSTVTYVGCKDYDDDIDNLQTQIDANKASIAELQNFVKEGKWVTAVETITDGFKITFNDGKSYSIVSGADGAAGTKIEIDSATKNWIIDGKDTGICSEGKKGDKGDQGDQGDQGDKGDKGEDGYAPQISEDGYWMVWDAEAGEPKKTDVKAATDIYVTADANNPLVWVLNILNKETGEWETVSMPKAARITSMRALGEQGGSIDFSSTEANATLYYGVVGKDVKFNGKSYPKGTFLSARGSMIHALINPVNLEVKDIQSYEIGLTDSKGNTNFVVASIAANVSETALTRAENTANKGIYDLTLKFAEGIDPDNLNENIAYALTTKDAWGNEIISGYDVKVTAKEEEKTLVDVNKDVDFKVTHNLDELVGDQLNDVVDYTYSVVEADAKKIEATFSKENKTIIANKEGKLTVTIAYFTTAGNEKEAKLNLTFKYAAEKAEIKDMTWVVDGEKVTATSEIVGPSVDVIKANITAGIDTEIAYTDGKVEINGVKDLEYEGGITLKLVGLDKDGEPVADMSTGVADITKFVIEATFDPAEVAAVPHTATVKFKNATPTPGLDNDVLYETTFKITVDQQDSKLFEFKRAGAYFSGDNATAYGNVNDEDAAGKITYNLYKLYQEGSISAKEKALISFDEEIPSKMVDDTKVYADAWLSSNKSSDEITVAPYDAWGGAYEGRNITVAYAPFGNDRLNVITDKFNLTVKSEIFEGTFKYIGKSGTEVKPFEVDGGHTQDLLAKDFEKTDAYGVGYDFDDKRIKSVVLELANQDAKDYVTLSATDFTKTDKVVISKKASQTPIVTPPVCEVNVIITDKWGRQTTETVYVKVLK